MRFWSLPSITPFCLFLLSLTHAISPHSRETYSSPAVDFNISGAQRWRSDESGDEEEQPSSELLRVASRPTPVRRSSRLSRR